MASQLLRRAMVSGATLFLGLLMIACASAPVQEMSDARQAIRAAQNAGAAQNQSAAPQLQNAQSLLTSAEKSLQRRQYRAARRDAVAARNQAVDAIQATAQMNGKTGGTSSSATDREHTQASARHNGQNHDQINGDSNPVAVQ